MKIFPNVSLTVGFPRSGQARVVCRLRVRVSLLQLPNTVVLKFCVLTFWSSGEIPLGGGKGRLRVANQEIQASGTAKLQGLAGSGCTLR